LLWLSATIPDAQIGGRMSRKTNTRNLRFLIAVIIARTGIRTWYQVLTGHQALNRLDVVHDIPFLRTNIPPFNPDRI
jgi:hypothetical protein